MGQDTHSLAQLVERDPRFKPAAYEFLFEALEFTRNRLTKARGAKTRHVTGQELAEGVRCLAIEQFGRLARTVLSQWGITSTSHIGDMVFNLIEFEFMEKTDQDSRSDFDNVFDFDEAFSRDFKISLDEPDA